MIGTGAAAFGVLDSLLAAQPDADITLIDVGSPVPARPPQGGGDDAHDLAAAYDGLYRDLFGRHARKFPPPKTHLGEEIARHHTKSGDMLYRSETFGGLTRYWGSTMLPYTDAEMRRWPFAADRLDPFYARIASRVGLAGADDAMLTYFRRDFATRPGIRALKALQRLGERINERGSLRTDGYGVVAGVNRCAIETRADSPQHCVYCGECMAGCVRGAVFSTADPIRHMLDQRQIARLVSGRVEMIDLERRIIVVRTASGKERLSGFSRVFLCAGCVGSTEILMRSAGIADGPVMADNTVHVFPIISLRREIGDESRSYLGLCNLILACLPESDADHFAQVQIYPNFDYMWRYNTPPSLWRAIAPLVRASRPHIFWGRLYLHSALSSSYLLRLEDGRPVFDAAAVPDAEATVRRLMRAIRTAVRGDGFYVPPVPPIRQRTNSHYGSTLPFGGLLMDVAPSGEIGNGIYLCDSAAFPEIPAVSPTFSIMANAARIAREAVDG